MGRFLLLISFALPITVSAQEPEYIGEVNVVFNDSVKLLDKEYMSTTARADASLVLFGLGDVHTKIIVQGRNARTRVTDGTPMHLIARAVDNNSDPMSVVRIFQFAAHHGSRTSEISSADVFGCINHGRMKNVKFTATKYGKSSYDISLSSLPTGEYGVVVLNPNSKDSRAMLIYCFGVGHPKKYSGWDTYGDDDAYR